MEGNARWTSRKFLLAVSAQVTAMLVLLWPQHAAPIVEAAQAVTALAVIALTALGYLAAEGGVDRARARSGGHGEVDDGEGGNGEGGESAEV